MLPTIVFPYKQFDYLLFTLEFIFFGLQSKAKSQFFFPKIDISTLSLLETTKIHTYTYNLTKNLTN